MILGGGPNRIGQGIEFDYCCVHASMALRERASLSIMVNNNPETVSTDYDVSDSLYFEPLTLEDVLEIVEERKTGRRHRPVRWADTTGPGPALLREGAPIIGTSPESIDRAEDRDRFKGCCIGWACASPITAPLFRWRRLAGWRIKSAIRWSCAPPTSWAAGPWRSSITRLPWRNTCGERSKSLRTTRAHRQVPGGRHRNRRRRGGRRLRRGHRGHHGAHRGSRYPLGRLCLLPAPFSLDVAMQREIRKQPACHGAGTRRSGPDERAVRGKGRRLYVLEVNPRASRTVPFVSKVTGVPWAKVATRVMIGIV